MCVIFKVQLGILKLFRKVWLFSLLNVLLYFSSDRMGIVVKLRTHDFFPTTDFVFSSMCPWDTQGMKCQFWSLIAQTCLLYSIAGNLLVTYETLIPSYIHSQPLSGYNYTISFCLLMLAVEMIYNWITLWEFKWPQTHTNFGERLIW